MNTAARIYAVMIPFYLLQRMCTNMLQVVRKSEVSARIYIAFGVLRLGLIGLFATTALGIVYIELFINLVSSIVLSSVLLYYTMKFDPDKIDRRAEGLYFLSSLKRSGKTPES